MRADISTVLVAWWQHLFIALGHCQRAWIVQCSLVGLWGRQTGVTSTAPWREYMTANNEHQITEHLYSRIYTTLHSICLFQ